MEAKTNIYALEGNPNHNFHNLKSTEDWRPTERSIYLIALFKVFQIVFASGEDKMFAIMRVFLNTYQEKRSLIKLSSFLKNQEKLKPAYKSNKNNQFLQLIRWTNCRLKSHC